MKICVSRFNIILLLLSSLLLIGCQSTKESSEQKALTKKYKKERALVQLHLAGPPNSSGRTIQVFRQNPIKLTVDAAPFAEWRNVVDAQLIEDDGGFAIQLQLDSRGAFALDTLTTAHRGKHIAVAAQTGNELRWLAAPLIQQRNASGFLTFTPDATRDEAERIVYGIKNAATLGRRQGQF